jgi:hypothetical protein
MCKDIALPLFAKLCRDFARASSLDATSLCEGRAFLRRDGRPICMDRPREFTDSFEVWDRLVASDA